MSRKPMSGNPIPLSLIACLVAGTALAEVPDVAVDIAPVHSLVARVMQGVGAPSLVIRQGASPHEYSLRPSEAQVLQDADLVFWMGEDLTPWMKTSIATLAGGAAVTTLLESEGTVLLETRAGALFEAHSHGDEGHDHGGGMDHAHEAQAEAHDHDHGAHDPHAWLSPDNAAHWLSLIAGQLSSADPGNARAYAANAAAAREEIAAVAAEVNAILAPLRDRRFIVFHDAYQYFETAFDFPASGAIAVAVATDPGPARIADIRHRIAEQGIRCVLSEPQFNPGLVATVMDGSEASVSALDPLGSDLEAGADLYPRLLRRLAGALADCFS